MVGGGSLTTVKLFRGDQSPWGFRLQGGKDWGTPLIVSKVNPGSLADQSGLKTGDHLVSIQNKGTDTMYHKDAQETIMKAGNNLEIQIQRGGTTTWKPNVEKLSKPVIVATDEPALMTKTSLAKSSGENKPVGSGFNTSATPFLAPGQVLVHKQFNSPLNIYSMKNIEEAIQAHSEVIAPGVTGINFMKPEAPVNKNSAVYQAILEEETQQKERLSCSPVQAPKVASPANVVSKSSPTPVSGEPSANVCHECGRLIVGVFCRVSDKSLHAECFKCSTCGTSLKNVGYFNVNDKLYCDVHAKQAARIGMSPGRNFEPITIRPTSLQIQTNGTLSPNQGAPKITIPTGTQSPSMLSPSVMSAMPWHSPVGVHHVDAPHSPGKKPTPPPVAPKPKFRPVTNTSLYQSHPQPYGMVTDAHRQTNPSSAKFSWPPPKKCALHGELNDVADNELSASTSANICESSTDTRTSFYSSQTSSVQQKQQFTTTSSEYATQSSNLSNQLNTSGVTGSKSSGKQSLMTGSRPAPRRGRGQIQQQGSMGVRVPICGVCGSPVRGPFVVALDKTWCPEHFVCAKSTCKRNLQEVGFVEEQGQLYCESCFESYMAPVCSKCNVRIKGNTLMALEKSWHPECFTCSYCKKPFGNSKFYLEDGNPYCEADWNEMFTTKCVACKLAIEAGDRWVEALNQNYHSNCFKCAVCSKNLEGQSFYAKAGRPYCKSHAR